MKKYAYSDFSIGLCGNPNVGKSTIFNALTGLSQHTGNWTGKTVELAYGYAEYNSSIFKLVDLPGIYSLFSDSAEEEVAREFICGDSYDALIVVLDATCLERNLYLAMQVLSITDKVAICVNLMDEAQRKGIHIDIKKLENLLGVPVVGTSAGKKKGLPLLMDAVCKQAHHSDDDSHKLKAAEFMLLREDDKRCAEKSSSIMVDSEHVAKEVIDVSQNSEGVDRKLDNIFTSKRFGIPIMGLFIGLIFWITLTGSNYPSSLLFELFGFLEKQLSGFAERLFSPSAVPVWIQGLFIEGCFRTTGWVVSVMLPPMAIFFPLFTFFEDLGYLPRVAFNLDTLFKKACAHGKQALCLCMGFGCNAVGVMGCRIIESPRERLIAILTNCFVPCNGRFPPYQLG